MVKKLFAVIIAAVMLLSFAACGGGDKPSGDIGDIGDGGNVGDGGAQGGITNPDDGSDVLAPGETRVEMQNDKIISTMNDGMGNTVVTEYIYKDGALSEIIMTMQSADAASAKALYDTYTTGASKAEAEQIFTDIKLDGKNVIYTYNESYMSAFSGLSMEQLAEILGGGVA